MINLISRNYPLKVVGNGKSSLEECDLYDQNPFIPKLCFNRSEQLTHNKDETKSYSPLSSVCHMDIIDNPKKYNFINKSGQTEDENENDNIVYSLKYLRPIDKTVTDLYIHDIQVFKRDLTVYPIILVNK